MGGMSTHWTMTLILMKGAADFGAECYYCTYRKFYLVRAMVMQSMMMVMAVGAGGGVV
jgi:hypothetical protein